MKDNLSLVILQEQKEHLVRLCPNKIKESGISCIFYIGHASTNTIFLYTLHYNMNLILASKS